MAPWRDKVNEAGRSRPTRVSTNGQIVLSVKARRAAGIEPGDLVVSVPVAPGVLLVEKVGTTGKATLRTQYESVDNPLRGVWGDDPDAWVDEIRGQWHRRRPS
jgi:bifunctional DNA-binding transcriptional regulator/antitoxin component of YhaV-PrlF toxin-antitoxin module